MATFGALLKLYTDEQIIKEIARLYPDDGIDDLYQEALTELRATEPAESPWKIELRPITHADETTLDVVGIKDGDPETYAMDFEPWERVMGSEVVTDRDQLTTVAEIVWEITFHGFSNEVVQAEFVQFLALVRARVPD